MTRVLFGFLVVALAGPLQAQRADAARCPRYAAWSTPVPPVRLFANAWYVGTRGLSAILFRVEDIRLIVNSHAHFDHAGARERLSRRIADEGGKP